VSGNAPTHAVDDTSEETDDLIGALFIPRDRQTPSIRSFYDPRNQRARI